MVRINYKLVPTITKTYTICELINHLFKYIVVKLYCNVVL